MLSRSAALSRRSPPGLSRRTRSQEPWSSDGLIPAPWEDPPGPAPDAPYCTRHAPTLPAVPGNAPSVDHGSWLQTRGAVLQQLLDEAFEGFQLTFPANDFAENQSLKLLLVHSLVATDRVPADAQLHRNLHLTEGLSG